MMLALFPCIAVCKICPNRAGHTCFNSKHG